MSVELETSIPFIDDGEEVPEEGTPGQYNLTITRNYQNKTRRVEISKILQDAEITNRSLSPVAPLAYESDTDPGKEEQTGAEFELTIKSNNSVIRIQGFDTKSTISFNSGKGENVYEFLSREVDKIFKKPEKEEIEKAMGRIREKRKVKPMCKRKNTWKTLARSIVSAQRRGSVERYPKMVLLQDEKPEEERNSNITKEKAKKDVEEKIKKKKEKIIVQPEQLCAEIEKHMDLLEEKVEVIKEPKTSQQPQDHCHPPLEPEDLNYSSVPPLYCQYPSHCPYVPVYRPMPYFHYSEVCCGGRNQKHSSTQTEEPEKDVDLPFGILSSFFPRIVVMKSFQEEVETDDPQIYEIPKDESPTLENETEVEEGCHESVQATDLHLDMETKNVEEEKNELLTEEEEDMPLTKIGCSIYEKLNDLALERQKEAETAIVEAEIPEDPPREEESNDITLKFSDKTLKFTLQDEDLNLRVENEKTLVKKSDLWHSSNGGNARIRSTPKEVSLSFSRNPNIVVTIRSGEEKKWTKEAKVGTDGIDIAGGDFVCQEGTDRRNLSPRTGKILHALKVKLEDVEGKKFPGLFFIQPVDSRRGRFPSDDYIRSKERERKRTAEAEGRPREYYCEECLATMRLLEDENPSVKSIVDKFERIIHLGSY